MITVALTEGLGLLLIIPLLAFSGSATAPVTESGVMHELEQLVSRSGLTFDFDTVLLVFVVLVLIRQLVVYFEAQLTARTRIDFVTVVRNEFFAQLGETDWRFLNGARLDQLGQILLVDSWRIGEAALHFVRILSGIVLLLANIAVAVYVSPLLSMLALGSIVVLTFLFSNRLQRVQKQGGDISEIHTNVYRVVENYLENIRAVKMAGASHTMQTEFNRAIRSLNDRLTGFVRDSELVKVGLQISGAVTIAIALLIAVNRLEVGGPELLLLVFITARFIPRVSLLNLDLHRLLHDLPAFEHAYGVLLECRRHPDNAATRAVVPAPVSSMGIKNVVVTYGEDPDVPILDGVNLQLSVGEMLAIAGPSGVGKSTLVDVFAGLLNPNEGSVVIDGETLSPESIGGWRKIVGYVAQSTGLLQDTIERNLTWVLSESPTEEELQRAIACTEMSDVILGLGAGLQTVVGRREGRLSGGERQRLAIARELLRNPRLLVLDEATNALDIDTEIAVLRNLRRLYPGLTVLIVAHRESAIAQADRVVWLGREDDA